MAFPAYFKRDAGFGDDVFGNMSDAPPRMRGRTRSRKRRRGRRRSKRD